MGQVDSYHRSQIIEVLKPRFRSLSLQNTWFNKENPTASDDSEPQKSDTPMCAAMRSIRKALRLSDPMRTHTSLGGLWPQRGALIVGWMDGRKTGCNPDKAYKGFAGAVDVVNSR